MKDNKGYWSNKCEFYTSELKMELEAINENEYRLVIQDIKQKNKTETNFNSENDLLYYLKNLIQ